MHTGPKTLGLLVMTARAIHRLGRFRIVWMIRREVLVTIGTLRLAMHRCFQLHLIGEHRDFLAIRQVLR
jgi:hypothetical protein